MKAFILRGLTVLGRLTAPGRRAARGLRVAFADFNRQQARLTSLRFAQDAYLNCPLAGPDTYAEFLYRTRGPLRHEPSARARLDGHPVH